MKVRVPHPSALLLRGALCLTLFAGLLLGPAQAGTVLPPSGPGAPNSVVADGATSAPLLAGWFDDLASYLQSVLTSRTRVIQFAAVGMLLALWIIWWKR